MSGGADGTLRLPGATLRFLGVRHHSPACARAVAAAIEASAPTHVLVEGPSDFKAMELFALPHRLPVALFATATPAVASVDAREEEDDEANPPPPIAAYYPLASHSPEWVALRQGLAAGARCQFIDRPSYAPALPRRSLLDDGPIAASQHVGRLADRLGFDDFDALWDHLFEARDEPPAATERRLYAFFEALRADEVSSEENERREAYMAAAIRRAIRDDGGAPEVRALIVTGGFHTPALRRRLAGPADDAPLADDQPPSGYARCAIDLVAYSYARLDALSGYASGFRGPAYYEALHRLGPIAGAAAMERAVLLGLRAAKQAKTAADAIALATTAEGLRRLRGHDATTRGDLRDAVRAALVKEELSGGHHPLLTVVDEVLRGTAVGAVAAGTPRPLLLRAFEATCEALGFPSPFPAVETTVVIDPASPRDRALAVFFHRLLLLGVPGIRFTAARPRALGEARRARFTVRWDSGLEPALLEASPYGASLEAAASATLEASLATATGAESAANAYVTALRAELTPLGEALATRLTGALRAETDLGALGGALATLLAAGSVDEDALPPLVPLLAAASARGLWLLESARALPPPPPSALGPPPAPATTPRPVLAALAPLRDALALAAARGAPLRAPEDLRDLLRRIAHDPRTLPAIRGGVLAWLIEDFSKELSVDTATLLRPWLRPETAGELLRGVFVVGREALRHATSLAGVLNDLLAPVDDAAFLALLPPLRGAFATLTPRERHAVAAAVAGNLGLANPAALLAPVRGDAAAGVAADAAVFALLARFGLDPSTEAS